MSEWHPIETAPKDGSTVILYRPNAPKWHQVTEGSWDAQEYHKKPRPFWCCPWRIAYNGGDRDYPPTHWMPLPESPEV